VDNPESKRKSTIYTNVLTRKKKHTLLLIKPDVLFKQHCKKLSRYLSVPPNIYVAF
jgi:hypothetical protein